jgi:hypothetical protein
MGPGERAQCFLKAKPARRSLGGFLRRISVLEQGRKGKDFPGG